MSKIFTAMVLVRSTRLKCKSIYGNPSYWVEFEVFKTKDYYLYELGGRRGYTASNSQCGYSATNFVGRGCIIEYHITQAGNIVIDTMKEV